MRVSEGKTQNGNKIILEIHATGSFIDSFIKRKAMSFNMFDCLDCDKCARGLGTAGVRRSMIVVPTPENGWELSSSSLSKDSLSASSLSSELLFFFDFFFGAFFFTRLFFLYSSAC